MIRFRRRRLKTPNPRKGIKTVWQKVSRLEWGPGLKTPNPRKGIKTSSPVPALPAAPRLKTPNPRKGITKPAEAAARAAFAAFAAFALNAHLA